MSFFTTMEENKIENRDKRKLTLKEKDERCKDRWKKGDKVGRRERNN
jgi:hypothetical protein